MAALTEDVMFDNLFEYRKSLNIAVQTESSTYEIINTDEIAAMMENNIRKVIELFGVSMFYQMPIFTLNCATLCMLLFFQLVSSNNNTHIAESYEVEQRDLTGKVERRRKP